MDRLARHTTIADVRTKSQNVDTVGLVQLALTEYLAAHREPLEVALFCDGVEIDDGYQRGETRVDFRSDCWADLAPATFENPTDQLIDEIRVYQGATLVHDLKFRVKVRVGAGPHVLGALADTNPVATACEFRAKTAEDDFTWGLAVRQLFGTPMYATRDDDEAIHGFSTDLDGHNREARELVQAGELTPPGPRAA